MGSWHLGEILLATPKEYFHKAHGFKIEQALFGFLMLIAVSEPRLLVSRAKIFFRVDCKHITGIQGFSLDDASCKTIPASGTRGPRSLRVTLNARTARRKLTVLRYQQPVLTARGLQCGTSAEILFITQDYASA